MLEFGELRDLDSQVKEALAPAEDVRKARAETVFEANLDLGRRVPPWLLARVSEELDNALARLLERSNAPEDIKMAVDLNALLCMYSRELDNGNLNTWDARNLLESMLSGARLVDALEGYRLECIKIEEPGE